MSPEDTRLVHVIAQELRDSGLPHGSGCPAFTDRAAACECQWQRSSVAMARNVLKAIVRHLNPGEIL